jgi:hypothetical protein
VAGPGEEQENSMHRCTVLVLGLAMLTLAGCGGDAPPVVQVSGGPGAAQALGDQIVNLQNQVTALQRRVDMLEARLPPAK